MPDEVTFALVIADVAFWMPPTFTDLMDLLPDPPSRPHGPSASIEERAITGARQRERAAMRRIYDDLAPAVAGYARGQGVEDPEALANETLFRVFDGLERFEGDADRFRSWAFTIAHNLIVDDRRRLARRPSSAGVVDETNLPAVESAEYEAVSRTETERMIGWIRELPPGQRDVLLLRLVADLSVKDVGRIVGKREGAVKAIHRRGLDTLRRRLGGTTVSDLDMTTFTEV